MLPGPGSSHAFKTEGVPLQASAAVTKWDVYLERGFRSFGCRVPQAFDLDFSFELI